MSIDNPMAGPPTRDEERGWDLADDMDEKLANADESDLRDWYAFVFGPNALAEYMADALRKADDAKVAEAMGLLGENF